MRDFHELAPVRGKTAVDAAVAALFVALALVMTWRAWADPHGTTLGVQARDQHFGEWMLLHAALALKGFESPWFTRLQNVPDGVNLMANVGMQLPGFILAPVTLTLGPAISYLSFITTNLAASGFAWFLFFSRRLALARGAALAGGLWCAFAPGMISHSSGHPHITAMFLVPVIAARVLTLGTGTRPLRDGFVLGLMVAAQLFIGEEVLFLTAFALAMLAAAWAASDTREARRRLPAAAASLAAALIVVLAIAGYPLWIEFFGPMRHDGHPIPVSGDLATFVARPTFALFGGDRAFDALAQNFTEQSAFFGWPVLVAAAAIVVWLRRERAVGLAAIVGLAAAVLSLGPSIRVEGVAEFPGPFALVAGLPVFRSMVIARLALVSMVAIGVLIAFAVDRLLRPATEGGPAAVSPRPPVLRRLALALLALAVLPVVPHPLPVRRRAEVPQFISSGQWRQYVAEGATLVPVPDDGVTSIRWQTAANMRFAVPLGYFLGPVSAKNSRGRWGAIARPMTRLMDAAERGESYELTDAKRRGAMNDVRRWNADAVVLFDSRHPHLARRVLVSLFGDGQPAGEVEVWDVRRFKAAKQ